MIGIIIVALKIRTEDEPKCVDELVPVVIESSKLIDKRELHKQDR